MRTELWISAYIVMGIGYHYGQTFEKTFGWRIIFRWLMVISFWPGVLIANLITAIGNK